MRHKMSAASDMQIAMDVSKTSIIINLFLSLLKLLAGIFAHSGAMISDAVHSASDVFSTFIVMIGVHISQKEADKEHPYGHERLECVASLILAIILFLTGIGIGINGLKAILDKSGSALQIPGLFALISAIISIIVKEWMYWYTRAAALKIKSDALKADAWHHRSDALSSIGALIGITGARMGFPVLDPIASLVICLFIAKAAYDIFISAVDKMVDKSCDQATIDQMRQTILTEDGVISVSHIQTRMFGSKVYVDVEFEADGNITLTEAHSIAERVHSQIETVFPNVKHCMVHVNPV